MLGSVFCVVKNSGVDCGYWVGVDVSGSFWVGCFHRAALFDGKIDLGYGVRVFLC